MKVKSPKGENATPEKKLSKKMKVNTPKAKTPKQDKTKSCKQDELSDPKTIEETSVQKLNNGASVETPKRKKTKKQKVEESDEEEPQNGANHEEEEQEQQDDVDDVDDDDDDDEEDDEDEENLNIHNYLNMKVKSPKGESATPEKKLSKKMKVNTPKAKTPKQDKTKSCKQDKLSDPKTIEETSVQNYNVFVTLDSFFRSKGEKEDLCHKDSVFDIIKATKGGRLTATGTMCFHFMDEELAQNTVDAIEDSDFQKDAGFSVNISRNVAVPLQRTVFIGRHVDVAVFEDVMKNKFKADKVEKFVDRRGRYSGLSILTFVDGKTAAAADQIEFSYAGRMRCLKPYITYQSTRPELEGRKDQERHARTKEILPEGRKTKLERAMKLKGKKEDGLKRKAKVMEEEEVDEVEEDDDDDDE